MKKVVVFETKADHQAQIKSTLDFLECSFTIFSTVEELEAGLSNNSEYDFVLLGSCEDNPVVASDVYKILRQFDKFLPLILISSNDDKSGVSTEKLLEGVIANVCYPLKFQSFQKAIEKVELYIEHRKLSGDARPSELFRSLVGGSQGTKKIRKLIEQVANTDASVLILGESGTGKEVVARNIHYHSSRRYKPFVPVNCGAIPSDLLESELFGHEKGAFTGAISARRGRFEMADGGTLFLDEIGDMPLSMQVKILRVLQERVVERVGSNKSTAVNVRIIAATHANLEEDINKGKFREDLYYRLNVFPIITPPLRERLDDLPVLINDLISRIENEKRGSVRFTKVAIHGLAQYAWPGNIRELANLIERMAILYPYGVVDVNDLPDKYRPEGILPVHARLDDEEESTDMMSGARLPKDGLDLKEHLNQMEFSLIQQALNDAGGVVAHAARKLNMGRTTLVEKMRKYEIQR